MTQPIGDRPLKTSCIESRESARTSLPVSPTETRTEESDTEASVFDAFPQNLDVWKEDTEDSIDDRVSFLLPDPPTQPCPRNLDSLRENECEEQRSLAHDTTESNSCDTSEVSEAHSDDVSECCEELSMSVGDMTRRMKKMLKEYSAFDTSSDDETESTRSSLEFNFYTFKAIPCNIKSQVHDRKQCPYFHNARDRRRVPVNYRSEQCEMSFDVEDANGCCEDGDSCRKCHNRLELLYHPDIFKQRFCAMFPKVQDCPRGHYCAFAHSRDEIATKLLPPYEEWEKSDEFYMYKFKTLWCPYGVQHDWHRCDYAHTYQDCRRIPSLGYGSEPCPFWDKNMALSDYEKRCPTGYRCQYSHGSKEQLYHPSYYKTMPCTDWTVSGTCPRKKQCAFFHSSEEQRSDGSQRYDYTRPLSMIEHLYSFQPSFGRPPVFALDDEDVRACSRRRSSHQSVGSYSVKSDFNSTKNANEFVPTPSLYATQFTDFSPWQGWQQNFPWQSGQNHTIPAMNLSSMISSAQHMPQQTYGQGWQDKHAATSMHFLQMPRNQAACPTTQDSWVSNALNTPAACFTNDLGKHCTNQPPQANHVVINIGLLHEDEQADFYLHEGAENFVANLTGEGKCAPAMGNGTTMWA